MFSFSNMTRGTLKLRKNKKKKLAAKDNIFTLLVTLKWVFKAHYHAVTKEVTRWVAVQAALESAVHSLSSAGVQLEKTVPT